MESRRSPTRSCRRWSRPVRRGFGWCRPTRLRRPADERKDADERKAEKTAGHQQQICRPERRSEQGGERRARERAAAAAGGKEAEQARRLLRPEQVGHETPEKRHHEQIENAHPDEEGARHRRRRYAEREQGVEDEHVGDEEKVGPGNEAPARQARRRPTEKGRRCEHDREGRRKEPGKVFNPALHAHLVAQRP